MENCLSKELAAPAHTKLQGNSDLNDQVNQQLDNSDAINH